MTPAAQLRVPAPRPAPNAQPREGTGPDDIWGPLVAASAAREGAGMARRLRPRPAVQDDLIDVASNDYLSLARDPRLLSAAVDATRTWGTGSTASRLVTGALALHTDLERALAELTGAADALLFSSGYLANLGMLTALTDADTLIVSDEQNHASLIDGCRLSRATVAVFRHGDVAMASRLLGQRSHTRAVLVTDAVFSVDGQTAPLAALHQVSRAHGAALVVDEAHAIGVLGPRGAGAAAAAGIAGEPDVVLSLTLSKALGAQGGAVVGPPPVIDALVNTARTMIFDTGLAPAPAAAALAAVGILRAEPELPARVRRIALDLREAALVAGWHAAATDGAVVSVLVGDPAAAMAAQQVCRTHGVIVGCFRPPSVPPGGSCLRLTARAGLTSNEIDAVGRALAAARAHTDDGRGPT